MINHEVAIKLALINDVLNDLIMPSAVLGEKNFNDLVKASNLLFKVEESLKTCSKKQKSSPSSVLFQLK